MWTAATKLQPVTPATRSDPVPRSTQPTRRMTAAVYCRQATMPYAPGMSKGGPARSRRTEMANVIADAAFLTPTARAAAAMIVRDATNRVRAPSSRRVAIIYLRMTTTDARQAPGLARQVRTKTTSATAVVESTTTSVTDSTRRLAMCAPDAAPARLAVVRSSRTTMPRAIDCGICHDVGKPK